MRPKRCPNCGAIMIYNELLERWDCNLCGYSEISDCGILGHRRNYIQ